MLPQGAPDTPPPSDRDARGETALRRADLVDRLEGLTALDRRLRLAFIPAGLIGGSLAGLTHAVLGEPMITLALAANTMFFFLMIQTTRSRNRRDREALREELAELDG